MEYIILSFAIFCIFYSTMAITMVRTLKPHHGAIRGQISTVTIAENTHCRACNVLLIEHNHGCKPDDLKQAISAETQIIKQSEDVKMELSTITATDTSTLTDIEARLLLDYYKYRDIVNQIKTDFPNLAKEYGILDDQPKTRKPRKTAPVAAEPETGGLIDTLAHYKTAKNKLGGSCGMVHTFTIKQANLDRINARFIEVWGTMPEREQLLSVCPDCGGHYRTSFERDCTVLEDDKELEGRKIRKMVTRYNCDDCGKFEIDETGGNGKYLKSTQPEAIPCPLVHDMTSDQVDQIADEPLDDDICETCGCNYFTHNDDGSCVSDTVEQNIAYANIM